MDIQEIIYRLGSLDLRLAEKEDYMAVYEAIELLKQIKENKEEKEKRGDI